MRTLQEYIEIIRNHGDQLIQQFGVSTLVIFGSVARNQHNDGSDLDVFVEMPAKMYLVVGVQQYLEELLGCEVDVIRNHRGLNQYLKSEIERDGVNVITAA